MISAVYKPLFRAATLDDCYTIARLFQIASDGVCDYTWSTLASKYPGLTPLEIGAKRYANPDNLFGYKNCVIAERNGEIVGMMVTFPIPKEIVSKSEPIVEPAIAPDEDVPNTETPDVLAPYSLEAPGTWYICALALFPKFRRQRIGTQLLAVAHQQAAERGFKELSLLCFEQNAGALKLYQRHGFRTIARAPTVPHPLIHHTGDVLLMTAPVQL